ncbi:tryptophanyl-tRNA synthetase, partial [mine drainage metagenome]
HIRLTRDIANRHRIFNISWEADQVQISISGKYDEKKMINIASRKLEEMGFDVTSKNYNYRLITARGNHSEKVKLDMEMVGLEANMNEHAFIAPSATYQKLITGLKGGKMSSSKPESLISLNDKPEEAAKKIKSATTGGRATVEEQKLKGGEPDKCPVFELYSFHLSSRDDDLKEINDNCRSGSLLCGSCKSEAAERMRKFLTDLNEKREEARDRKELYIQEE